MGKNIQYNRLNSLSEEKTKVFFHYPTKYRKELYNFLKQEANKGTFTYDNIIELPAPRGKSKFSIVLLPKNPNSLEVLHTINKAIKDKVKIHFLKQGKKAADLPAHNMKEQTVLILSNREKKIKNNRKN